MHSTTVTMLAGLALAAGLAGCAADGDDVDAGATDTPTVDATTDGAMDDGAKDDGAKDDDSMDSMDKGAELTTAESDFGTIVVDADGNVVYQFDADTQGAGESTCVDMCAENWPAVPGTDDADALDSVYGHSASEITGVVGSITGVDGNPQLTLNGWPLYYFVGDAAPGDTAGQGVNEVWWVLTPEGEPIRE